MGSGPIGSSELEYHTAKFELLCHHHTVSALPFVAYVDHFLGFTYTNSIYSFSLFLPTIIAGLGYTRVTAQLFTVPPNMGAFLMVLFCSTLSDRIKARGPIMLGGCCLAIIGYVMLLAATRPIVRYGGTFFIAAGVFPSSPAVMGW